MSFEGGTQKHAFKWGLAMGGGSCPPSPTLAPMCWFLFALYVAVASSSCKCTAGCDIMQGVEATLFATLMSVLNGGAFLGSAFGSLLTKVGMQGWPWVVRICWCK